MDATKRRFLDAEEMESTEKLKESLEGEAFDG